MTVHEALTAKREERRGTVKYLVLCQGELFYLPQAGTNPEHTVYPVSIERAAKEAHYFGVQLHLE